jgi:hypothetical protein
MNYIKHLIKNWKVAKHSLFDFWIHFIHGLIPIIKIEHPYQKENL